MEQSPLDANANNRSPFTFNPGQHDASPVASLPTRDPYRPTSEQAAARDAAWDARDPYSLTSEQAAFRYNVSRRTLATWRTHGMPFLLPGPRKVLFITADADAWVRAKFSVGRPKPTLEKLRAAAAGTGVNS